jgi:hypothetical protein
MAVASASPGKPLALPTWHGDRLSGAMELLTIIATSATVVGGSHSRHKEGRIALALGLAWLIAVWLRGTS